MRLGLLTYNIASDWDLDTLLSKCTELGYEGIEPRTDSEHAHGVEVTLSKSERREVKKRIDDSEVVLCGLSGGCMFDSPDPAEVARNVEHARTLLQLCCDLGAPGLKVFGNVFHEDAGIERAKTIEQVARALSECAATANEVGVEVRLAMHADFVTSADLLEVMHQADHPQLKLIYSTQESLTVIDGSVAEHLHEVMPYVTHVYMHELSDPNYPFREMLELLAESGYTGFCVAEIQPSPERDRLLAYYHDLWHAYVD